MPDDFVAHTGTTGTVAVGGSAAGTIETARDIDWFAVELVAGRTYIIDLEGKGTGSGTLANAMLYGLFDGTGHRLARREHNGDEGGNARMTYVAAADGTHYIAAKGYRKEDTGTYTLRVTPKDADSVAAGAADLGDLAGMDGARVRRDSVDGEADGTDYWRFTLSEAREVVLRLQRQDADADLFLEDENGVVLYSSANGGTMQEEIRETLQAGTYYARVEAQEAAENAYNLRHRAAVPGPDTPPETDSQTQRSAPASVSEPADGDLPADISTAGRIAVGAAATGAIAAEGDVDPYKRTSTDVDWFKATLEKGKTYRIDVKGLETGDGTLPDPYLAGVYDAGGNVLAGSKAFMGGKFENAQHFLTVAESGAYYVAAGGEYQWHDGGPVIHGTYTVSLSEVTDDFAAGTGTTGTVAAGGSTAGAIETPGDLDWFKVTLDAGKTYRFDMRAGYKLDAVLHGIYDAGGELVASLPNFRTNPHLYDGRVVGYRDRDVHGFFEAAEDGTYYVAAGADAADPRPEYRTGGYVLSMTEVADDFADDTATVGTVAAGGSATGTIEARDDVDWFAVALTKGVKFQIDLKAGGTGDGTLRDPYLRGIYDAKGDLVAGTTDDDGGAGRNSRVSFTPAESGTYYVAAKAFQNDRTATDTGTYTVQVTAEDPDATTAGARDLGDIAAVEDARVHRDSVDGRIDGADYYRFTLSKAREVRFDLRRQDADADLFLEDENGAVLYSSAKDGTAPEKIAETLQAGTYYVRVEAQEAGDNAYSLRYGTAHLPSVSEPRGVDFDARTDGNIGRVAVGGSAKGRTHDSIYDRDMFAVDMERGKTYRIDVKGQDSGNGTLDDPVIHGVYDRHHMRLPNTRGDDMPNGDLDARVFFTAPETTTYYVVAGGFEWDRRGTYRLFVDEHPDDFAADTGTTGRVPVYGWAKGEITLWNDSDWFAVELQAGKTYQIEMKGDHNDDGTMVDTNLRGIHDANGNLIPGTANDNAHVAAGDHGWINSSRVFFTPTASGTYYVEAGAVDHNHGYLKSLNFGTYTVRVTDISTDDFAAGADTAGTVEVGGFVTGRVETPHDRDWFAVALEAGKFYRFDLTGGANGETSLRDPSLYGIHDADGNLITGTTDDNSGAGTSSRVLFKATATGTYYVAAGADDTSPDVAPNYYGWAGPGSKNPNAATDFFGPGGPEVAKLDNLGAYTLSVEEVVEAM